MCSASRPVWGSRGSPKDLALCIAPRPERVTERGLLGLAGVDAHDQRVANDALSDEGEFDVLSPIIPHDHDSPSGYASRFMSRVAPDLGAVCAMHGFGILPELSHAGMARVLRPRRP